MDNNYYKLYLKYKLKYLKLKEQIGGGKYITIKNSGYVNENGINMYNQCMWISIRDYLSYVRGINITVQDLKNMVGLGPDTYDEMFDWETPRYRDAIMGLCQIFDICINAYLTLQNGETHPELVFPGTDIPMPMHIINEHSNNVVPIAFYGAHFELILSGPYITTLIPFNSSNNFNQAPYQPKVFMKSKQRYVTPDQLITSKEIKLVDLYVKLINNKQEIDVIKKTRPRIYKDNWDAEQGLQNLSKLTDLNDEERMELSKLYKKQIVKSFERIDVVDRKLKELIFSNTQLEQLISDLEK
jgi:hypothetical protein